VATLERQRTGRGLRMPERWTGVLFLIFLLGLWEYAVAAELLRGTSLPRPSASLVAFYNEVTSGELLTAIGSTLRRIGIAYFIAVALAVPLGALMGASRAVYNLFEPVTELVRPIPSPAYIPIAVLLLGIGDSMKIAVVVVSCFFPILLNTYEGVRSVDRVLLDTGRTFRTSRREQLLKIILPASLPSIFTGMRISLAVALIVMTIAEMLAGNEGIGYFVVYNQRVFRAANMFAGVFMLALVGYTLNTLFNSLSNWILRWRVSGE
jgi:ABC-type nitrate/sulfonate/bicarbonate transport system permease component